MARHYPDAIEDVAYNTTVDGFLKDDGGPDGARHVHTDPLDRSPATFDEYWDIREVAFAEIDRFLQATQFPKLDGRHTRIFEESQFGDYRGDRTLDLPLMDERMFDLEFVQMIQSSVLSPFPLWRLRFGVREYKLNSVIYPDAVSLGDSVFSAGAANMETELASWREAVGRVFQADSAPYVKQLSVLQARLPRLLGLPHDRPFRVVAAFPFCGNRPNRSSVWLLVPGNAKHKYDVDEPGTALGDEHAAIGRPGSTYPVHAQGVVGERFWRGVEPLFWVEETVFEMTPPPAEIVVEHIETGQAYRISLNELEE